MFLPSRDMDAGRVGVNKVCRAHTVSSILQAQSWEANTRKSTNASDTAVVLILNSIGEIILLIH